MIQERINYMLEIMPSREDEDQRGACNHSCGDCPFSVQSFEGGEGVGVFNGPGADFVSEVSKLIASKCDHIRIQNLVINQPEARWDLEEWIDPRVEIQNAFFCFGKPKRWADNISYTDMQKWLVGLNHSPRLSVSFVPPSSTDPSLFQRPIDTILGALFDAKLNVVADTLDVSLGVNHASGFARRVILSQQNARNVLNIIEQALAAKGFDVHNVHRWSPAPEVSNGLPVYTESMHHQYQGRNGSDRFELWTGLRVIGRDFSLSTQRLASPPEGVLLHAVTPWGVWKNHTTLHRPSRGEFLSFDDAYSEVNGAIEERERAMSSPLPTSQALR